MVGLRANPCLAAIDDVMKSFSIPYDVEHGGKHPRISFFLNGKRKKVGFSGSPSDVYGPKKAAAEVKRAILAEMPEMDFIERMDAGEPTQEYSDHLPDPISEQDLQVIDEEPRIHDLRLGQRLGLSRPDRIREMIRSNANELSLYGNVLRREVKTSAKGGRPGVEFYLTEPQALLVAMKSNAPLAPLARFEIVEVCMDWRRAQSQPVALPAPAPSEILANMEAIDVIVIRVAQQASIETANRLLEGLKPLLSQQMAWGGKKARQLKDCIDGAVIDIQAAIPKNLVPSLLAPAKEPPALASIVDVYVWASLSAIPKRASLGAKIRHSIDSYFADHPVATQAVIDANGLARKAWPKSDLEAWFKDKGKRLIQNHCACINSNAKVG